MKKRQYKDYEKKAINEAFERIVEESNRTITFISFLSLFFNIIVGISNNEILLSIALSSIILLVFYTAKTFINDINTKTVLAGFSFTLWAASFVAVSHGLTETRFLYFVFLFVIVIYQNRALIIFTFSVSIFIEIVLYVLIIYKLPFSHILSEYTLNTPEVTNTQMFWTIFSTFATGVLAYWRVLTIRENTINSSILIARQQLQLRMFEENRRFAEEISKGNLDVENEGNEENKLNHYLSEMRNSIKEANKRLQDERFVNDFVNLGVVEIDSQLRRHFDSVQDFAFNIITAIVNYLDADIGSFYSIESENDNRFIELKASHAYGKKHFSKKRIEIGEGLIGTAYLEKEITYLTEIPDNYIKIETGIGVAKPRCIIIVPLVDANEVLVGIIEIASFKIMEEYKIKFLENISTHIATAIVQKKIQQETKELLQQSQKLASEIEKRNRIESGNQ